MQLITSIEGHNILVGCFFTFAIMINLLTTDNNFIKTLILFLSTYRLITIHIHNMNVYFFDKFLFEGEETLKKYIEEQGN